MAKQYFTQKSTAYGEMILVFSQNGIHQLRFNEPLPQAIENITQASSELHNKAQGWVSEIIKGLEGNSSLERNIPLEPIGTPFQQSVWQYLQSIESGQVRTYSQVAKGINKPTAVRAVARACATNPIAILIPCHRVIGSNGKLTGYRWGIKMKQRLLQQEKVPLKA